MEFLVSRLLPGRIFRALVLIVSIALFPSRTAWGVEENIAALARSVDLAWLMVAAALVMMMQVGFLLLEAGMVRSKNSINVAQKNLLDFVFGVVAFAAIGFMIAFGRSDGFPFGVEGDFFFLKNLDSWESGFFVFQVMFCGTAATIVSGAVAERMKLVAYVFGSLMLSGLIYPIFAHWTWGTALRPNASAFLANLGFVDFAGSTVVHATGGWISLAACMIIGPRLGRFDRNGNPVRIAGHSPVLSTTGGLLLFFGWIGFNGGSTVQASPDIAPIILNTVLAGGIGTCVGYVLGYLQDGVVLPEKSLSGMLGALVAVTAGCHILTPGGALVIGALGSVVAIFGNEFVWCRLKIDDAVGAIGVHAFAGVAGTLGLALLAPVDLLPAGGRLAQLYVQAFGSALNFYWAFGLGYVFFWSLDRIMRVRVTREDEEIGLNVAEHATRLGVGHVEDAFSDLVGGKANLDHRLPVVAGDEAEKLTGLFNRLMDNIEMEERAREEIRALKRDHEEAERVTALANATFEAIVIHQNGIIVDGNEQLGELIGIPLKDLIGHSIFSHLPPEDQAAIREAMMTESDSNREITVLRPDGERVPVELRGRDIAYRGGKMRIGCLVDLRERKRTENHIRHLALHDPLTGLPNRALFAEKLGECVERANAGWGCAMVIVDLDHFKDINDIYGHPAGDAVIREAARRLTSALGKQDLAARLGGDEFAVILSNASFEAQLEDFGRRLVAAFREPIDIGGGDKVKCALSIGAALCPEHAGSMEDLIGCADTALYHAKNSGRNTWKIFKPGMNELIEKRRALEVDLDAALERDEFELFLQPRINAVTAEIVSYEALLRWRHPERGLVSPADFIPVAEVSGKIVAIGEWVLEEACRILDRELPQGRLSVNVSSLQFRHAQFAENLERIVRDAGIDPRRLELEITESVLIDDDSRARHTLRALKALGFDIALDDFGTGYSSLSYLSRYPFDTIKIDQGFVRSLGEDVSAAAIVRSIIDLGERLGMNVVAEGVETLEQALFLAHSGCNELQGYLLGRPMPVSDICSAVPPGISATLMGLPRKGAMSTPGEICEAV
ncbi:MAG: ammonium transporter [Allorhizobium sp.]